MMRGEASDAARHRGARGFTLIEVLAAVFLMSVVIAIAVGFYINLSNASARATTEVRRLLRATTALDRITRDLESVMLLRKPEEVDPLSHPWFFTARTEYAQEGSDQVKFITGSQRTSALRGHTSDIAQMAYFLVRNEEAVEDDPALGGGGELFDLYRWSSPGLPSGVDLAFPEADDPRSFLLIEGLSDFSLRFRDEEGEWIDEWDSTQLVESSELPAAIEIRLAFPEPEPDADRDVWEFSEAANVYARRIALAARPLDLEALILASQNLEKEGEDGEVDEDALEGAGLDPNMPVSDAVNANWEKCVATLGADTCSRLQNSTQPIGNLPFPIPDEWIR